MQRGVCPAQSQHHEASLRHQTQRLQTVPGRVPRDLRAGGEFCIHPSDSVQLDRVSVLKHLK